MFLYYILWVENALNQIIGKIYAFEIKNRNDVGQ